MTPRPALGDAEEPDDTPRLAELAELITGGLLAGESLDAEAILARHPPHRADPIRALLPTMLDLADLGRDLARDRRRDPPSNPSSFP
jgi:hypothetical protein